jgi:hypothetical protein
MIAYYNQFNFSPITYFDYFEIIISSTKDFIIISIFCLLYFQSFLVLVPNIGDRPNRLDISKTYKEKKSIYFSKIKSQYLIGIISFIIYFILDTIIPENNINFAAVSPIIFFGLYFIIVGNTLKFRLFKLMRGSNYYIIKNYFPYIDPTVFFSLIILFFSTIAFSVSKSIYIRRNNPYQGTLLVTESNEIIKCTSKVLFIGKSQKYYFLFNTPDSSIRIISRDNLKKEVIKINPNCNYLYRF